MCVFIILPNLILLQNRETNLVFLFAKWKPFSFFWDYKCCNSFVTLQKTIIHNLSWSVHMLHTIPPNFQFSSLLKLRKILPCKALWVHIILVIFVAFNLYKKSVLWKQLKVITYQLKLNEVFHESWLTQRKTRLIVYKTPSLALSKLYIKLASRGPQCMILVVWHT